MPKADFLAFWEAVSAGNIPMLPEVEITFMDWDTSADGSLDATELDV